MRPTQIDLWRIDPRLLGLLSFFQISTPNNSTVIIGFLLFIWWWKLSHGVVCACVGMWKNYSMPPGRRHVMSQVSPQSHIFVWPETKCGNPTTMCGANRLGAPPRGAPIALNNLSGTWLLLYCMLTWMNWGCQYVVRNFAFNLCATFILTLIKYFLLIKRNCKV